MPYGDMSQRKGLVAAEIPDSLGVADLGTGMLLIAKNLEDSSTSFLTLFVMTQLWP